MAALIPGPPMSTQRPTQRLYRVTFLNQGQVYEIYAKNVSHGGMMGFVEIEKIVFGERSSILVDPGEEKLKAEFENVERTYVPVHAVVRIDQVSKPGPARILPAGESGKVTALPLPGNFGGEHRK
jgi:hypothetical protein